MFLREEAFTGEQWKILYAELQRRLKAKNTPVRVLGAGQSA